MNNIQIQTQMLDEQVNVQELAQLTYELWKITRPEINPSIEAIGDWIKNLEFDNVPVIIKAYKEDKLVGWLLLFVHDSKRLAINPWALGGHPHLSPNEPDKLEIAQLLLEECTNYASKNTHTRMELCYEKKDSAENYVVAPSTYPLHNLLKVYEIVFMTKDLSDHELLKVDFPEEMTFVPLKEVTKEDFYSCFYDSFRNSRDRSILSHTEEELKEFFEDAFDEDKEMVDEASIVLVEGSKRIGFSLVRPTHGEGNGHLWELGVIPEYRGRHLGTNLLNHAITTLKKLGYKTMSLVVDCDNTVALNLYTNAHFIQGWRRITHIWKEKATS